MAINTGIKRKIDKLGRVVIPIEIRNSFRLNEEDEVEIYVDKNFIMFKKHSENCMLCNSEKSVKKIEGYSICEKCLKRIRES